MKVYITKYALDKGILEADVPNGTPLGRNINVRTRCMANKIFVKSGEWYLRLAEARRRVHAMVDREIEHLESSIRRLRKKSF
jgi:hypothetical protein